MSEAATVHYVPRRLADPAGGCLTALTVGRGRDDTEAYLCLGRPHRDIGPMPQHEGFGADGYPERTWHRAETCRQASP
jgi:hypothetical protein